jgi:hypothetical protein
MTEPHHQRTGGAAGGSGGGEFDREIDLRSVLTFAVALALVTIVVLGLLWVLMGHWKRRWTARDPRPSPMAEANAHPAPPEPRLQSVPVKDMEDLRARETSVLSSYGWVDRQAGVGRIPIDRAVDLLLEAGLQVAAPAPTPARRPRLQRRGGAP